MKFFLPAACTAAALLSGCQAHNSHNGGQPAPTTITAQHPRPALQLQQLWLEGDMTGSTALPVAAIHADSDRVTLSWNGDAVELLSALARARGQIFSYAGVRLPLPLDIDVQGVTYANLLRIIQMQTAWRATLVTYPGQMVLQFMSSLPAEQVRGKKGSRR
ncbi:DotD/TraH family lipoprotein [Enterobacter hormaechei]|nr:DotD/TraH family lipoprotein [Enterobacter hormaechei]ELD3190769.1 DotD/TraH family lipoprotein [Enterobacter hormaechei]